MLIGYPTGPGAGESMTKLLRLADSGEGIAADAVDQPVDPLDDRAVNRQPVCVVLPSVWGEYDPQGARSCSSRWPLAAWSRLSRRRRAFLGPRRRCAVSCSAS